MHESRFDARSDYLPPGPGKRSPLPFLRNLRTGAGGDVDATGDAEFTLILVHHAGGSAMSFMPLRAFLPDDWRLLALELPGRGAAAATPVPATLTETVSLLLPALTAQLTGPYALFGHSMGALVGYELARELEKLGLPPVLLGVSASPAPHLRQARDRYRNLRTQEELAGFLRDLGGTPPEVLDEPELLEYMTRVLRIDLTLLESYTGDLPVDTPADPPGVLGVPLAVYYGEHDPMAGHDLVSPWADYSSAGTSFCSWPGGHFYLFDQPADWGARWARDVRAAVRLPQPRSAAGQEASWV
ncbi:alpha/beta fold hydrolase [Streptomyces sp. NPDC048564]|uniref:thioesterase II family protein n=1 Tax=Streptomyces sp. NPDC048564 TaxID=3155760 RepID=UPI003427E963